MKVVRGLLDGVCGPADLAGLRVDPLRLAIAREEGGDRRRAGEELVNDANRLEDVGALDIFVVVVVTPAPGGGVTVGRPKVYMLPADAERGRSQLDGDHLGLRSKVEKAHLQA